MTVEIIIKDAPFVYKLPLYFILSILLSTNLIYLASLVIGFSRFSILLTFSPFVLGFLLKASRPKVGKYIPALILSLVIFFIFVISLYHAIFYKYQNYIVMGANNWQDTAMHMGIIESIANGNFPPQAPYFAGQPLSYYYFSDFHTSILEKLSGEFNPRILIVDNALFAGVFFLSLYSLVYYFVRKNGVSLLSAFVGTFFGNLCFIEFVGDLIRTGCTSNCLSAARGLIASNGYAMEYNGLYQITVMADYFMQNRPMMVGLPAAAVAALLVLLGFRKKSYRLLLLAALIQILLFKFQFFSVAVIEVSFVLLFFLHIVFSRPRLHILKLGLTLFLASTLGLILMMFIFKSNTSVVSLFLSNFRLGPWSLDHSPVWYMQFIVANFGISIVLVPLGILVIILKNKFSPSWLFISLWGAFLFATPFLVRFTIFDRDMFKFFYFFAIPLVVLLGVVFSLLLKHRTPGRVVVMAVVIVSCFSSFLTLTWSYLNRNMGYTNEQYQAGIWIRENTPQKSVFLEIPTVHSPVDQIGGRLRVLSYINWPHSHGYNTGVDNVFSRLGDINSLYMNSADSELVDQIVRKYNVNYIYYGGEERRNHPEAERELSRLDILSLVYNSNEIKIYAVK